MSLSRPPYDEVFGGRNNIVQLPEYIRMVSIGNEAMVRFLKMGLHPGESEAIALALEHNGSLIILDDKEARLM